MEKRPKNPNKGGGSAKAPLAVFATVLVVCGIAGAAFLSSTKPAPPQARPPETVTPAAADGVWPSGTAILLNSDSVTLVEPAGNATRLAAADFWEKAKPQRLPAEGSAAANGSGVFLLSPEQASGTRESYLSPDRRYVARLGEPKRDNAASIEVYQGRETPQSIVLRDRRGRALSSVYLLGWLGPRTLAAMAVATSTRGLYAIEINGAMRQIAQLPDDVVYAEARAGAVWYATAQLGEGLESAPTGPSEMRRITPAGEDTLVSREESRVFQIAVPDGHDRVMYTLDDGQAFLATIGQEEREQLGKLHPLGYLPDKKLLLREGFSLVAFDPETGESKSLADLPEGEVKVFVLP
jgi:hypothetical protein